MQQKLFIGIDISKLTVDVNVLQIDNPKEPNHKQFENTKKGFKEMFGSIIFDFYQSQRMEHAKYLLYEKGLSVTEVSALLGYSSISHFSTAFKKHTGINNIGILENLYLFLQSHAY